MCTSRSKVLASCLVVALFLATTPSFAAPTPAPAAARLTGTVYADDVTTPLAGATVIVTDSAGVKTASQPTQADGAFTIAAVAPGRTALALETKAGTFAVATPVTLAPGEARGVRLALKGGKAAGGDGSGGGGGVGGSGYSAGAIAAMTVVLVGVVAATAIGVNQSNDDSTAASPSQPDK